jgi:hypothetical protein
MTGLTEAIAPVEAESFRVAGSATAARRLRTLMLLVPAFVPLVVFAGALLGRSLLAPGDGALYYFPMHVLTTDAWSSFQVPAWNPFAFSGTPLLAASQSGAFYPLNAMFLVLPALYANNVVVVLNLAIASTGAAVLARRLTDDTAAATVAGIGFASCGFMYGHIAHQSIEASIAWLPWVLVGYESMRERPSARSFALTSGALALSLLGGHSQMFFLIVFVVLTYAAVIACLESRSARRRLKQATPPILVLLIVEMAAPATSTTTLVFLLLDLLLVGLAVIAAVHHLLARRVRAAWRRGWIVPALVAAACSLAAVQLIPTASIVGETVRAHVDFSTATAYSFSPSHLALLLFPYLFGNHFAVAPFTSPYHGHWNLTELAGYPGLACIVFAAAGLPRIRRDPRAVALVVTACLFFVIALGASTGAGVLVWLTPLYGQFRAWGRYVVVVDLVVALMAAYGVAHLRESGGAELRAASRRAWAAAAGLGLIGIVVPLLPPVARFAAGGSTRFLSIAIPLSAAAVAAAACLLFRTSPRAAVLVCCLVVALDGLLSFGAFFEWRTSPSAKDVPAAYSHDAPPSWGAVPRAPGGFERYLFAGRTINSVIPVDFPQATDVKGLRSVNGYDPLAPGRYLETVGGMEAFGGLRRPQQFLGHRSALLDLLRVTLVLVPKGEAAVKPPQWLEPLAPRAGLARYRYRPRVPDAFLVGQVSAVPRKRLLAALSGSQDFDPRQTVLVDGPCGGCAGLTAPGPAGEVSKERWQANRVDLELHARRPSMLVVSQSWFPGWKARVDGRDVPTVRVDGVVTGVPVPAGRHVVELDYQAPGLVTGAGISLFAVAALTALVLLERRFGGLRAVPRLFARRP